MARQKRGETPEHIKTGRAPLNMKASPELRRRIEEAAEEHGLSLTQEVERRLIQSFRDDDQVGGHENRLLLSFIATVLQAVEAQTGKKWFADPAAWAAATAAIRLILIQNRPPYEFDDEHNRLVEEYKQVNQQEEAAGEAWAKLWKAHPEIERQSRHFAAGGDEDEIKVDQELSRKAVRMSLELTDLERRSRALRSQIAELDTPYREVLSEARDLARTLVEEGDFSFRVTPRSSRSDH